MLRLKSLGQTLIEVDNARLTPVAETLFATALYLVMEAGKPTGRDELARLIWPDVSEVRAQHGLRQVLYRLKSIGAEIESDRSAVALLPRSFAADYTQLLAHHERSEVTPEMDQLGGIFLPGYHPQFSEQFTIWVERRRDFVHSAMTRALVHGIGNKKSQSDWRGAERMAKECLVLDPLNEEATLTIAEAAALGGSKAKALSILNHYLDEIGTAGKDIRLPAVLLRNRISEASRDNVFSVRDTPFLGRDEEMAELARALVSAESGRGSTYLVWGEPGIGKTRLVTEFTRIAALKRVNFARVGCQSHDVRRPLSAFVDLIPQLLTLPGALGCSPESMGYLRRLTAHDPDDSRDREELEQLDRRYDSARRALIDVIDAVSMESCCILQMEDAHWLDHQSLRMVEELSNWVASRSVLFLLTSRTGARASHSISSLNLRPLAQATSSQVAFAMAEKNNQLDADFVAWCVSSSGGNPYYLIELLRNGTRGCHGFHPPACLARLLQDRVSLLSSDARSLLEVCCILGKHSTLARITACVEQPRVQLLNALTELEAAGMVELEGEQLLSRHYLLTSAVLANMSASTKALLHRFVATQLEAEAMENQSVSLLWESSEHWHEAADASRARLLLRRCGNHLLDIGMPEEAARVLARACSLALTAGDKYSIGAELARSLMRAEKLTEAIHIMDDLLLMRSSMPHPPAVIDEVGMMYIQAKWERGDPIQDLVTEYVGALSQGRGSPQDRVRAAGWLLTEADNICDLALGRRIYALVAPLAESTEIATDTRLYLQMVFNSSFGDGVRALALTTELLEHARRHCSPAVTLRYLRHSAHVHRCHGSSQAAISLTDEAYLMAARVNSLDNMIVCASSIAGLLLHTGDYDAAEKWLAHATEIRPPEGSGVADTNLLSQNAELAIVRGEIERAQSSLEGCADVVANTNGSRPLMRYLSLQARICILRDGTVDDGLLQQLSATFDVTKTSCIQDYSAASLLMALEVRGRQDEARSRAAEYLNSSRRDLGSLSAQLLDVTRRLGVS